jgi:thiosulfate/3-mercaptopyruvate sulfurtransferase
MRIPVRARLVTALAALAPLGAVTAHAQCGPPDEGVPAVRESLLVSTGWLAAHLRDPDLVIVSVQHMQGMRPAENQIPGARAIDAVAFTVGSFDLAPAPVLDSLIESLGISNTSRVVLYGDPWVTGFIYVALDYLGHGDRTAILDGGLEQWRAENRSVAATAARETRATFTPHLRSGIVVDAGWLTTHLRDANLALLDVRTTDEYQGHGESHGLPRGGHIPGARLVRWAQTFERPQGAIDSHASKLLSPAELRALFRTGGVTPGTQPVTYCTVGMRASHVYFVLRYLGYNPKFYDGSMTDWSQRSELPVLTGPARGTP